jgi:hypothetical protein
MCSYCRALFEPFFTPRGGIADLLRKRFGSGRTRHGGPRNGTEHARFGARAAWNQGASRKEVLRMYIGGGLLALLVIVLLLVWLF